jgi:hypothetical protein
MAWAANMPLRGGLSISHVRDDMLHRTITGLGYGALMTRGPDGLEQNRNKRAVNGEHCFLYSKGAAVP